MGGNAVPGVRRFKAAEYYILLKGVGELLSKTFKPFCKIQDIPSYLEKEDFGDIDILVDVAGVDLDNWKGLLIEQGVIKELFTDGVKTDMLYSVGPVSANKTYSFEYKGVQVDVIFAAEGCFDAAYNYFSWNDLGNLLGRVVHKFGMSLGHEGLVYRYRPDGQNVFQIINVSKDWSEILHAFGWDYDRFLKGFKTKKEIFDFVQSTHFFNPDIYLLDNRNAVSRVRDAKRVTYQEFLKYCEEYEGDEYNFWSDKINYLSFLFQYFPDFRSKYLLAMDKYAEHKLIRSKFNGDLVMSLTGLNDKELGALMQAVRKKMGATDEEVNKWILKASEAKICYLICQVAAIQFGVLM